CAREPQYYYPGSRFDFW
nr:immunoglobulin heavy chain junction region [Macaca mulatta]MOX15561.1 immunoglobulin heavy chain junction region [Macaca mulatta]MOX15950.1 immunoglobulin heavy chain junction region [Macaca mulatta]MOX16490.1 immunoglobulin heavy chain junction region [Macaca mulatta]